MNRRSFFACTFYGLVGLVVAKYAPMPASAVTESLTTGDTNRLYMLDSERINVFDAATFEWKEVGGYVTFTKDGIVLPPNIEDI